MKMKQVVSCIIYFLFALLLCSKNTYAKSTPMISADKEFFVLPREEVRIPVRIENNSCVMGFFLTLTYKENVVSISSIENGDITQKGIFDHNLGKKKNKFDVLWSYTEDVNKDGTLFYLNVKTTSKLKEKTKIKIAYSKSDTFNESFEEIDLMCKEIVITPLNKNQEKTLKIEKKNVEDSPTENRSNKTSKNQGASSDDIGESKIKKQPQKKSTNDKKEKRITQKMMLTKRKIAKVKKMSGR